MSRGAVIAAITAVLGALVAAFILRPFSPGFLRDGLDPSWVATMGDAADRHARWGVDLAFTYGPATPLVVGLYNGAYFTLTLPLLIAFALVFGLCAAMIVARPGRSALAVVFGASAAAVAIVGAKGTADALYLSLPFLVFLVAVAPEAPTGGRRLTAIAGGFAMGLTAMAKMSFPLAALPLFLVADTAAVVRRRLPLLLVPFAIGVVVGDLAYGQRLADLPAYVRLQGEVVAGYAAAMALAGPIWDLGAYLLLGGALVGIGCWVSWRDRVATPWAFLVPLGVAIDLFFLLKAGFIRHDLHSLIAWRGLVIVAIAAAFGSLLPRRRRLAIAVTTGAIFVTLVYEPVLVVRQSGEKPRDAAFARFYGEWLAKGPPQEVAAALAWLRDPAAFRATLEAKSAEARAQVAAENPLGPLPGTVDVLPSQQSRVLAAGLDYDPRPSFQEYSTYTEGLSEANRAFVESTRAPDWILFGPEGADGRMSIDERYPNLDEGALWPDLMRLYRPDHRIGSLVALKRRSEPASLPVGKPVAVSARLNIPVAVPFGSAGAVWATIDLRPNLLGRLASLLFRPPLPGLAVRLDDGETRHFRFVPALGRAGFVLSPVVFNAADYTDLAEDRPAAARRRVEAVTLEATRATIALSDADVRFTFSAIDTSSLRVPGGATASEASGSAWDRLVASRPGGGLDESDHVRASAPSLMALSAGGLRRLTIGYGVADGAWQENDTAGVCFAVSRADGKGESLWHRCLDPLADPRDRGLQTVSLDLPADAGELALTTTCRNRCGASWGYWAKPEDDATGEAK